MNKTNINECNPMCNNSKNMKLYNVLFPLWMLWFFPMTWAIVIPGNFLINSIVLIISMVALKIADKKQWYKRFIFKIFAFSMLADFIGSIFMFWILSVFNVRKGDELYVTIPGLILSAVLIFVFNYRYTFKKIDKKLHLKLSIIIAIFTAPYAFLVPTSWLFW